MAARDGDDPSLF